MSNQKAENDYIERACEVMHDAYEAAAVAVGWETQERSRKPWADVPEANKATMRAAVSALLAPLIALADDLAAWDLVDMPAPESVDVPDDYELGMNHAGAQLHAALRFPPASPPGCCAGARAGFDHDAYCKEARDAE